MYCDVKHCISEFGGVYWRERREQKINRPPLKEYIGEIGEGGERNMKRELRKKIYENSMRFV